MIVGCDRCGRLMFRSHPHKGKNFCSSACYKAWLMDRPQKDDTGAAVMEMPTERPAKEAANAPAAAPEERRPKYTVHIGRAWKELYRAE